MSAASPTGALLLAQDRFRAARQALEPGLVLPF